MIKWLVNKISGNRNIKKTAHEVFTPRRATVNDIMYIPRPDLESALWQAFLGSRNILIHGQSGCGKSWLYKRVFSQFNVAYETLNLALSASKNSISAEFRNLVDRQGDPQLQTLSTKDIGELKSPIGGIKSEEQQTFVVGSKEPFEACLEFISLKAKGERGCLVLENLEAVFKKPDLMQELASYILLLDDERYAGYNVKLLIVGVPSDVRQYFAGLPDLAPISNRIDEVPEVTRLSTEQAIRLMRKGFEEELQIRNPEQEEVYEAIAWNTFRIPEKIHDLCLTLALEHESTYCPVNLKYLEEAKQIWLQHSFSAKYSIIENLMNAVRTSTGRRNQTLFALGKIEHEEFKPRDVETIVRSEFPNSTANVAINTSQILSELSAKDNPIIKRTPRGDAFMFVDPESRMCLRAMLQKAENETVSKTSHSY